MILLAKSWKCNWCTLNFAGWSATKALYHVAQVGNCDVQPCKFTFDEKQKKLYKDLFQYRSNKRSVNTLSNNEQNDSIIQHNVTLATQLDQQHKKVKPSAIITLLKNKSSGCTSSVTTMTGASSHGSVVVQSTMTNAGNKDYPSAESQLTMAISNLIHSCGLPFSLADDSKFCTMLLLAINVHMNY